MRKFRTTEFMTDEIFHRHYAMDVRFERRVRLDDYKDEWKDDVKNGRRLGSLSGHQSPSGAAVGEGALALGVDGGGGCDEHAGRVQIREGEVERGSARGDEVKSLLSEEDCVQTPIVKPRDDYEAFLATKSLTHVATGVKVQDGDIHPSLFPFQRDLTKWALAKGRSAIFAGTGLGKTRMSLEYARLSGERVLILAPLAVANQTVAEAKAIGMEIVYARNQKDAGDITITNYEMLDHFKPEEFGCVVLDESSLLKAMDGKTRKKLTEAFKSTPLRLCCTATPAPNDIAEIANHAEFLGIMTRVEMLATFFVHDDCFAAGTLVDTPDGELPIQSIKPGQKVFNAFGVDEVIATSEKNLSSVVEVQFGSKKVFCSEGHLWLTARGWMPAIRLTIGDRLVTHQTAVRMVRSGVHGEGSPERTPEGTFLRPILLGEMANESSRVRYEPQYPGEAQEAFRGDNSLLCVGDASSRGAQGAGTPVQAVVATRGWGQDQGDDEGARAEAANPAEGRLVRGRARGQRARPNGAAGVAGVDVGRGMGSRGYSLLGVSGEGTSQLLPRRFTSLDAEVDSRDRRPIPQETRKARAGSAQGRVADFVRVDGIAVHQSGSAAFGRVSGGKDTVTLYDLTVRNHPSFSVEGVLVHNCGWRLKGHAREAFYKWLASWGISLRRPSDLNYSDEGYELPPLRIIPHFIETDARPEGQLFAFGLKGITDRSKMRKATLKDRVAYSLGLLEKEPYQQWLFWCGLNDEQDALAQALGDKCFSVYGSLPIEEKVARLEGWLRGERPHLVSKTAICGFGLNMQICARQCYVGQNDSWEQFYQGVRRSWRFGQKREVHAHIVLSEAEQAIYSNVMRKEAEADKMASELIKHVAEFELSEIRASRGKVDYLPQVPMRVPEWLKGERG